MAQTNHRIRLRESKAAPVARDLLLRMWCCLTATSEGIRFDNHSLFDSLTPILADLFRFPANWYHQEISQHVSRAVLDCKSAATEEFDDFLAQLNRSADKLLSAKAVAYAMWTKLSLHDWGSRNRFLYRLGSIVVVLRKDVPQKLRLSSFSIGGMDRIDPEEPKGGIVAIARGRFRSDKQAGNGLYEAISDLTAIINFAYLSRRREWRSGKVRPKAKLLLGDNQYLFKSGRSLNRDTIWYNADFRSDFWAASNFRAADLQHVDKYLKALLHRIQEHPSGERVLAALRMMGEGSFSHDVQQRILRTWTAFEILLSRSAERADRYEEIVRRASFIAKDRKRWELQLFHAARTRNRYVHENAATVAAEAVADTLDAYLSALIDWILFSKFGFESHERLLDTLDLPTDARVLERQIADRTRAIEILRK